MLLRQLSSRGFFVAWIHQTLLIMKRVFSLLAGVLVGSLHLTAQNLDSLLREVHDRDQTVREEVIRLSQQVPPSADSLMAASARMQAVDVENQRIVSDLLGCGWPEGLSDEANETIWLVIDHAGLGMQKRWMPLVKQQMEAGKVSKSSYATLLDRMLMREKLPQRYGTQAVSFSRLIEGDSARMEPQCWLWPVEEPERLDSLRSAMELSPIEVYLREVEAVYGIPCRWDPNLSVRQVEALRAEP